MAHRDVVVVGASAGGVEALRALVGGLPPDYPLVVYPERETPESYGRALQRVARLAAGR